jgi:hypothetical protein
LVHREYAALMTSQNLYVENCMLSSGDVIAGVSVGDPLQQTLLCNPSVHSLVRLQGLCAVEEQGVSKAVPQGAADTCCEV